MGIMIYRDKQAAGAAAAALIAAKLIEKPNATLGMGVSYAATPIYTQLVNMTAAGVVDWSETTVFHTSELLSTQPGMGTIMSFLHRNLYKQVGMDLRRVYAPAHYANDMETACNDFENKILNTGGMDLILLYLGNNGHIAMNGPAREFPAFTHIELLPQSTMEECSMLQPQGGDVAQAITMGLSTALSAKQIILCAFGKGLSGTVERALNSTITPAVPASMLQLHPNVTYIFDEDAAVNL
ncbi:6-phosphogluconolactonase [Christensenellaceae bacterium OttesenSCG-928-M15]|nr:6-phosphogluconolactonase [Christensenellaceae bacterium OttesenSCG-928-M15]